MSSPLDGEPLQMRISLNYTKYLRHLVQGGEGELAYKHIRSTWSDKTMTLEKLEKYAEEARKRGETCFP